MPCKSACLKQSLGYRIVRRYCISPLGCESHKSFAWKENNDQVEICTDETICKYETRTSKRQYASKMCSSTLGPDFVGSAAVFNENDLSQACRIYCRSERSPFPWDWKPLKNSQNNSEYFPDGTWCHWRRGQSFYCQRNKCLPYSETLVELEKWKN